MPLFYLCQTEFSSFASGPARAPGKLKTGEQSLKDVHLDLAAQWHPTLNIHPITGAILGPEDVAPSSGFRATWVCKNGNCNCPHIWPTTVAKRSGQTRRGCPFCTGQLACPCKSLAALHPNIASEWDCNGNDGLLAGDGSPLTSQNCPPSSHKKVWWTHFINGVWHVWQATVKGRTREGGTGYPECNKGGGPRRMVFLAVDCPWLVDEWDVEKNGKWTPYNVTRGMHLMVWWKCPNSTCHHPHSYLASINGRGKGRGCPYCAHRKVCPCNSLQGKYPKLDEKGADEVFPSGNGKVFWDCPDCGHEYLASPNSRTTSKAPTGCPKCCGRVKSVGGKP